MDCARSLKYPCCVVFDRLLLFLFFILTFPCSVLILNLYSCVKYKTDCRKYEFWNHHFGIRSKILPEERIAKDAASVLKRYMEKPPVKSYSKLKQTLVENPYINAMLVAANNCMPNMFFHVELTGSLCERFGKPLPSTSALATDYDLMLVASRLTVFIKSGDKERTTEPLEAINYLCNKTNKDEPYYWIQLTNETHEYLKKTCLYFHEENKGSQQRLFISSSLIKPALAIEIEKIGYYVNAMESKSCLLDKESGVVYTFVDITGPAINVQLLKNLYRVNHGPIENKEKNLTKVLLNVDFTLALPCYYWPDATQPWFERSHAWITRRYKNLEDIKKHGLHFVPRQSRNFIEEIFLHEFDEYDVSEKDQAGVIIEMSKNKTKYTSLEWRLSFSLPEVFISFCVPEIVRWSFMILKSIIIRYVNEQNKKNTESKKLKFRSYFLKNTLYWYLDDLTDEECSNLDRIELPDSPKFEANKFDAEFWNIFEALVKKLQGFLNAKKIPYFWWFQYDKVEYLNLIEECVADIERLEISKLLSEMVSDKLNVKASLLHMCCMEADLEVASKKQMQRSFWYRYSLCKKKQMEEEKFDHIEAHRKFIYSGIPDPKLFKDRNCLPFCECCECCMCCECCSVDDEEIERAPDNEY